MTMSGRSRTAVFVLGIALLSGSLHRLIDELDCQLHQKPACLLVLLDSQVKASPRIAAKCV